MSTYAASELGTSFGEAGLAASIFVFGGLAARISCGRYTDRADRRRILIISLVGAAAVSLGYFFIGDLSGLYVLRFVHGFFYGLSTLAVNTMIAHMVPPARRGEGIGYFMLSLTIASAIGPFLCMFMLHNFGYTEIFVLGIATLISAAVLALFVKEEREKNSVSVTVSERSGIGKYVEVPVIRISVACMLFFFSYSGVLTFMTQYGEEIDLVTAATYFFVTVAASTFISRIFAGRIYDKHGENVVLIPCYIMFIAGMIILSQSVTPFMLLFSGFLMGFGIALVYSIGQSIVVKMSPKDRYAVATATFGSFIEISYGLGPLVLGLIITAVGYRDMYLLMAGLATVSFAAYMLLHGLKARRSSVSETE